MTSAMGVAIIPLAVSWHELEVSLPPNAGGKNSSDGEDRCPRRPVCLLITFLFDGHRGLTDQKSRVG